MLLQTNVNVSILSAHLSSIRENDGYNLPIGNGSMYFTGTNGEILQNENSYLASGNTDGTIANTSQLYLEYNQQYGENCSTIDVNTNYSYWNVTCDISPEFGVALYGHCMPFLLITTIITNSLIVLVLRKKNMATPTNFVLMGM